MATTPNTIQLAITLATTQFKAGADAVEKQLNKLAGSAKKLDDASSGKKMAEGLESVSKQLGRIQNLYVGLQGLQALGGAVGDITKRADEYKLLESRLKLVSDTTGEAAKAQSALFGIAQQNSVGVNELTTLYTRLATSLRSLGRDQQNSVDVTEAVALSMRISGATTAEASSAMMQLSQAFSSGALRGEEFNAVNESAPRLMKALADGMGQPIESMRALAEAGKITSKEMADALPKALEKLRAEAATIPLTVGAAFTQLTNALNKYIGEADKASGVSSKLAAGIKAVAENLPQIAGVAAALAVGALAGAMTRAAFAVGLYVKEAAQAAITSAAAARGVAALGTTATVAAVGVGVLARALGSVAALFGGPIGLAIAAIGVAWALFDTHKEKAKAAADEIEQKQKALSESLKAEKLKLVSFEKQAADDALKGWTKSYDDHLKYLQDNLRESLKLEQDHANKIKDLRLSLAQFEASTADQLRELKRKQMTEEQAAADVELEISEKLTAAQVAATAGRVADSEALAKQAAQLASQTKNTETQIRVVTEGAQIVKQAKLDEIAATENAKKAQEEQTAGLLKSIKVTEDALHQLDAMKPTPKIDADISQAKLNIAAIEQQLANIKDKTVVVTVVQQSASVSADVEGFAGGGRIAGPGTGTSDSILARISNGEYIIKQQAASRVGYGVLDYINRLGSLPKFATGGAVNVASAPSSSGGITIQNLNLPGVQNAKQLVAELKQMMRMDPGLLSASTARAG